MKVDSTSNELPLEEKVSPAVKNAFITDAEDLIEAIRKAPKKTVIILNKLKSIKNVGRILNYNSIARLCQSLESLYNGIYDKTISFNKNILILIGAVLEKIEECCTYIKKYGSDDNDIQLYVHYCDMAIAGEIFEVDVFRKDVKKVTKDESASRKLKDKIIEVHSASIGEVLNAHEEMIARSYKINNQINSLKPLEKEFLPHKVAEIRKQLAADFKILQTELESSHEEVFNLIKDDEYFASGHQELHGFFVYANGVKYLISGDYIADVTYESPLNYVTEHNQLYLEKTEDDKTVLIPVYFLSSLFPGQREKKFGGLDTIFIAEYQDQKVGIIVDHMQTFISIVKKPLPACFVNFPILQGVVFDEKYDMIPILYVPEILKKFRSLRGYDVKKYEVNTKPRTYRILIVDDSETTRQIERSILSGFLVDQAVDGIDAMEKLRSTQYDLILTDDSMPRMNGEILIDNLRLLDNYVKVPVVAMASKPLEGADAFIDKADFKRSELIHSVKELLK